MMPSLELVDGFSLANCRACVEASAEAYDAPPTVQSPLAHVLIQDCGNAILVAFRGTKKPIDFLTDLEAWYSRASDLRWAGECGQGRVHHGFARALESIAAALVKALDEDLPSKPIILTGHSLGGAMSQLFAGYVPDRLHSVYTFGGPRAGDRLWADRYDAAHYRTFRVVNQVDIIARAPGLLAGYRHTGIEVLLTPAWSLWVSPPWWLQLWADLWAVWSDVRNRRLGVLIDHHVSLYCQRLGAAGNPKSEGPKSEPRKLSGETRI